MRNKTICKRVIYKCVFYNDVKFDHFYQLKPL